MQALEALALRRLLERGQITREQYCERLTQGPEGEHLPARTEGRSAQLGIEALEALALRRRLDSGELTLEEYFEYLIATPESTRENASVPDTKKAALPGGMPQENNSNDHHQLSPEPTRPNPIPIGHFENTSVSELATPERFMLFKCPRCGEDLHIYDRVRQLRCSQCEAKIIIEREHCTISVRVVEETAVFGTPDVAAEELETVAATVELQRLAREAHQLGTLKTGVAVLGGCCGLAFASVGIIKAAAREFAMGTSALVSAGALFVVVVLISRDMNAVAGGLELRMCKQKQRLIAVDRHGAGQIDLDNDLQ